MSEENNNIKFPIHITEEDYINFNVFHSCVHRKADKKKAFRKLKIVLGIYLALTVFRTIFEWVNGSSEIAGFLVGPIIIVLGISCFYYLSSRKHMERLVRKNVARMKKNGALPYQSDLQITIEADRIVQESPTGLCYINRVNVHKIYDEPDYYYIYLNEYTAVFFPKREVAEYDEQIRNILEL